MKRFIFMLIIFITIPLDCQAKDIREITEILYSSISEDAEGKVYVGIEPIGLCVDINKVCELGQAFYTNGIPFIVQIDPHMDCEGILSFKQYAQVMRYLQAKGGVICFIDTNHEVEIKEKKQVDEIRNQLSIEGINVLSLPEDIYWVDFQILDSLDINEKPFPKLGIDIMIEYEIPTQNGEILEIIEKIKDKWLEIISINQQGTIYTFNECLIEHIEYEHLKNQEYKAFFNVGNKILLIVVSISLCILTIGIGIGYRLYQKKFYK